MQAESPSVYSSQQSQFTRSRRERDLTWLHISDIHFHPRTEWRDDAARNALLKYLRGIYDADNSLRPDLIFCTGDIAFGETDSAPLATQYGQARSFFDALLGVCGGLPRERLFVVPGNHDVNRRSINSYAQVALDGWAREAGEHAAVINQHFDARPAAFRDVVKRLDEYAEFLRSYLGHQSDPEGRHCYARVLDIGGLKVGVAGFNSAWSCAGTESVGTLWMAAEWQFNNAARAPFSESDIRLGLVHHPPEWLNETDREVARRRIAGHFHFWLHGHSHDPWVTPGQSHIMVGAGAVGAEKAAEFGINIVRLDLAAARGVVHLHAYSPRDGGWAIATVPTHAADGRWHFDLPPGLCARPAAAEAEPPAPAVPAEAPPDRRRPRLFGREELLEEAAEQLQSRPFLLVYGLRGNGKSALIEALGQATPLAEKGTPVRYFANPGTTPVELFRQFATILGETDEFPNPPSGGVAEIAEEVRRLYPNPRPAWVWVDYAHHLLGRDGFLDEGILHLLLGLQSALGERWRWVFECRERPVPGLLGDSAAECEVLGLDRDSLAECLTHGAPPGLQAEWSYGGRDLKSIYQWLGGGHGKQAHPLAIQLLIEVARGRGETPLVALKRHRGDLEQKIEEKLLGDLYNNVLGPPEQRLLKALALYRTAIPHDHAEALERRLAVSGAWERLDRRCLLSSNADHSQYYVHSFIAGWVRMRMGYEGHGEDAEADFADGADRHSRQEARELHSAVAACWLGQLGRSRRVTNLNIGRALEAFHHLTAAGEADRVQDIAVEMLTGNREWANQRIERLYKDLHRSKAPAARQIPVLEYAAILNPNDFRIQRFLGECWVAVEGRESDNALKHFKEACRLGRDYPPCWANLGRTLLARGKDDARDFLRRLEELEEDCPQAINDHVRAVQFKCLELIGEGPKAARLRMERIRAGSRHPALYTDAAKALLADGKAPEALEVLNLAEENGCADDITAAVRADALQQSGQTGEAAVLRTQKMDAGSRNPAFYNDAARELLEAGDWRGALAVLNRAEQNGCANAITASLRASILRKHGAD